ncbi:CYTH and CHAD domain-containing protein [Corynebacterium sp. H78]|uniref:CYTH and CHAD domain-containing protein n=1 Tax=Corynebacterium sp. H78 TaxID=3133417 RepID=UPI0030B5BE5B
MTEKAAPQDAPTKNLEIEAKFVAGPNAVAPSFDFVPGVGSSTTEIRELSAIYFDTEDLRLTRNKRTLRRRTGGPDAGWHLKTPAANGRMEYGAPMQDDVPASLLAPVRSLVRNHELKPVAQVDNERHVTMLFDAAGSPIAEFCDDHVTAKSFLEGGEETTWREWEIELIGDIAETPEGTELMDRLTAVLKVAGAVESDSPSKLASALGDSVNSAPLPPAPADLPEGTPGRAVVDALAANVAKLIEVDPAVRRDEWDSVHQMRVATRELRSHMQTFHGILVGPQISRIENELKVLAGILGVARDAEVVAERFENQLKRDEADVISGETRENLITDIRRDYDRAHKHCVFALDSNRYLTLLDDLEDLLANPPVNPEDEHEAEETQAVKDTDPDVTLEAPEAPEHEDFDRTETGEIVETAPVATPATALIDDDAEADSEAEVAAAVAKPEPEAEPADAAETETAEPQPAPETEEKRELTPETEEKRELTPEEVREQTNRVLAKHLRGTYKKFERRHRAAIAGREDQSLSVRDREERFHDVRKAAKKVRYSAEAARATGLPTDKLYAACKKLQSSLGDFQDTCTAREVLLEKARRAQVHDQDTFGYGVLYQIERYDGLVSLQAYDDDVEGVIKAFAKLEAKIEKAQAKADRRSAKKAEKAAKALKEKLKK